jgi:ribosomal protein S18 acetylase RimI-like enzyme
MTSTNLVFCQNKSSAASVLQHLEIADTQFIPPLSEKVELAQYAKKIYDLATRFEAWEGALLIGLIAVYKNKETNSLFITNVSVLPGYKNEGVAKRLMLDTFMFAKSNNFSKISLEVNAYNSIACKFYEKFGFLQTDKKNDSLFLSLDIV